MTCSKLDPYQNRFCFFALDWIVWISIVSLSHNLYHVCCLQLQTSMQITNNASFPPSILTIADFIIHIPINTCLCTHIHSSLTNNSISCATTVNQVNFVWNVINHVYHNDNKWSHSYSQWIAVNMRKYKVGLQLCIAFKIPPSPKLINDYFQFTRLLPLLCISSVNKHGIMHNVMVYTGAYCIIESLFSWDYMTQFINKQLQLCRRSVVGKVASNWVTSYRHTHTCAFQY